MPPFEAFRSILHDIFLLDAQCLKLRVYPAPEAHISDEGRIIFGSVHPMCTHDVM